MLSVPVMSLSKWNSYILLDGESGIIYNAFTDRFIVVKQGSRDLYHAKSGEIDRFSPLFRTQMVEIGALVDKSSDEAAQVDNLIHEADFNKSRLQIIINPTLDCNFKCWYCYENHIPGSCMSAQVRDSVVALVGNRLGKYRETVECQLSFFGGEPLLQFEDVVRPLIAAAGMICDNKGVRLSLHFTTNGYLINAEMVEFLRHYPTSFQITLDGGKRDHDRTRFAKGGVPSYDVIMNNIFRVASAGMHVTLRINYTANNIESCRDVIDDLRNLDDAAKKHIVVDFQRVWQDSPMSYGDTADAVAQELRAIIRGHGIRTSNNRMIDSVRNSCYADKCNEMLVNYNGDVFFCTARDFDTRNRGGQLKPNGVVEWNESFLRKRLSCKFRKTVCRTCRIAPICGGGCRTKCLEMEYHDKCNMGYSEDDIDNLILDRFIDRYMP